MRKRLLKLGVATIAAFSMVGSLAACSGDGSEGTKTSQGDVVLKFSQWWEPELPKGSFRELMDQFEKENPGIMVELLSGPYANTKEQLIAGSAAGKMPDVVGLDGAWVYDFKKQGSLANLSEMMQKAKFDESQLASQIKLDGSTYMIPVVNFVYPLFTNNKILKEAGVDSVPTNRTEFSSAAKKITEKTDAAGWALPLSLETPNGIQNDVMSWVWASGGSMLKDGKPDITNSDVKGAVEFIKGMWDDKVIAPGAFSMKEQDKVEEFTNGRAGMMVSSLAHINTIKKANPDLDFSVSAIPAKDGYKDERGIPYASWGIGVSSNTEHPDEAWKLVQFLMSKDTNGKLSTIANAFPGNSLAKPDFSDSDPLFEKAFEIYQAGYPANEFVGLPVSEELMRSFSQEFQKILNNDQSVTDGLATAQKRWIAEFK